MARTNAFSMVSRQEKDLQENEIFQGFLANGYDFYPTEFDSPLAQNEIRNVLKKWFYTSEEKCKKEDRTYAIRVHVFDLYGLFTYPQDGSMPRFLFQARLRFDNAVAGSVMLDGMQMKFRVSTFAEAEIAAEHLWNSLGRPNV
jgi:hypothetical protein